MSLVFKLLTEIAQQYKVQWECPDESMYKDDEEMEMVIFLIPYLEKIVFWNVLAHA